ncbi:MAG: type II toxin-antitoxin system VapC family toxin [Candidatus Binatia bacterium]
MRVLLDTHTLIWAVDNPTHLGAEVRRVIEDHSTELLISAATVWEIAIKVGLNKLTLSMPYLEWMNRAIADLGATILPITVEYANVQATLPKHHRDPFDRMLIAQAQSEDIHLAANEGTFDRYGIKRLW